MLILISILSLSLILSVAFTIRSSQRDRRWGGGGQRQRQRQCIDKDTQRSHRDHTENTQSERNASQKCAKSEATRAKSELRARRSEPTTSQGRVNSKPNARQTRGEREANAWESVGTCGHMHPVRFLRVCHAHVIVCHEFAMEWPRRYHRPRRVICAPRIPSSHRLLRQALMNLRCLVRPIRASSPPSSSYALEPL